MSEFNVTRNKLRRNNFPTIMGAINAANFGDTIIIHTKRNTIGSQPNTCLLINKGLHIWGANPDNPPTLTMSNHQVAFYLQSGNLDLKNLNIILSPQARGIMTSLQYAGNIKLTNVSIWHAKKIKPQEYSLGMSAFGTQQKPILNANVSIIHCRIDYMALSTASLQISNSMIGKLNGKQSVTQCLNNEASNTELTHTMLKNMNTKQPGLLSRIKTKGLLSLQGNFQASNITFLNGVQRTNHPLSFFGTDPVQVLKAYGVTSPMPFLETSSFQNEIDQIKINQIIYDKTLFQLQQNTALVHPYSFNFYNTGVALKNTKIMPNIFGDKNITQKGSLMLEDVNDKSEWIDKNTSMSSRGKTHSPLFSQLPTGSDIEGKKTVDPIQQLKHLIGLKDVKNTLLDLIATAKIRHLKAKHGIKTSPMSMHMVFQGDPGTGKTTVARLVGKALYKEGVTHSSKFVEVEGNDLMAGYMGQTKGVVRNIVGKARGGILFIDEAYALADKPGSNNEFADEAVDELIAQMENHRDDLIVIMAGYRYQMQQFFKNGNPGLTSRFTHIINFPDYSDDEMRQILQLMMNKDKQQLADQNAGIEMVKGLKTVIDAQTGMSGNGRLVRNFLQAVETKRDRRLVLSGSASLANASTISASDAKQATETLLKKQNNEN